jgi:hypothetical protein
MSGPFIRKLNFKSYDLGTKATLVLTFDSEKIPGIYKDVYPTAFKCVYSSLLSQRIQVIFDQSHFVRGDW